jgi:exosome complex component RRP42
MPSATSAALPFSPAELSCLHTSLASIPPIRSDSRSSTDFRALDAETGVLPLTNGSAHVSFSDGSESIVGIKLEVERNPPLVVQGSEDGTATNESSSKWISLSLTLPSSRDDDASLIYLEEMLREPLLHSALPDKLIINSRFHWHIYVDVLLISPHGLQAYPLPLLSLATHLALRDTRIPRLKSEGEEDPVADDDWLASQPLFPQNEPARPPITLLTAAVSDNILFDPSHEELKVADAIVAVSIGQSDLSQDLKILSTRMIDSPARDTMKGIARDASTAKDGHAGYQGVWQPKLGGVKRSILKNVVKLVLSGGVARDIMQGLDGFIAHESRT